MFQVSTPQSSEDWQAYYQLRWQVLRAPWGEPRGSEQDDLEQKLNTALLKIKQVKYWVWRVCTLIISNKLKCVIWRLQRVTGINILAAAYCMNSKNSVESRC